MSIGFTGIDRHEQVQGYRCPEGPRWTNAGMTTPPIVEQKKALGEHPAAPMQGPGGCRDEPTGSTRVGPVWDQGCPDQGSANRGSVAVPHSRGTPLPAAGQHTPVPHQANLQNRQRIRVPDLTPGKPQNGTPKKLTLPTSWL